MYFFPRKTNNTLDTADPDRSYLLLATNYTFPGPNLPIQLILHHVQPCLSLPIRTNSCRARPKYTAGVSARRLHSYRYVTADRAISVGTPNERLIERYSYLRIGRLITRKTCPRERNDEPLSLSGTPARPRFVDDVWKRSGIPLRATGRRYRRPLRRINSNVPSLITFSSRNHGRASMYVCMYVSARARALPHERHHHHYTLRAARPLAKVQISRQIKSFSAISWLEFLRRSPGKPPRRVSAAANLLSSLPLHPCRSTGDETFRKVRVHT